MKMNLKDLPNVGKFLKGGMLRAAVIATNTSMQRGRGMLVSANPVNTGTMRASWQVMTVESIEDESKSLGQIYNGAPYAAVVEMGARPHEMSKAGLESIARWAQQKLGKGNKEAMGIAFAVAKRLREEGQQPTFFIRDLLPEISKNLAEDFDKQLKKIIEGLGK